MPRISLCMIARDEERMLPDCLASVRGLVDDIVLVDTGSRDRTREIAAAAGARVFDVPWNDDFSAPRNEALRRARGDWLLHLDADERLAPGVGDVLRRAVRAKLDVGMLPLHNAARLDASPADVLSGSARRGTAVSLPRLFRNVDHPRYTGIVHETIEEWMGERRRRIGHVPVPIIHLGAIDSLREARGKDDRNLALLRRRCEQAPDDLSALGYLAGELSARGDLDGASAAIERGWAAIDGVPRRRSILRLALHRARLALLRDDAAAMLESIDVAEQREGGTYDTAVFRGTAWELVYARTDDPSERVTAAETAMAAFARAISLFDEPASMKLSLGRLPDLHVHRGHASLVAGRPDEAARDFARALEGDPSSVAARLGVVEVQLRSGDGVGSLRRVEGILATAANRAPDGWLLAAEAARTLGAVADADQLVRQARARAANGFIAPHRRRALADAIATSGGTTGDGDPSWSATGT